MYDLWVSHNFNQTKKIWKNYKCSRQYWFKWELFYKKTSRATNSNEFVNINFTCAPVLPELTEGALPNNDREIIASWITASSYKIGDEISFDFDKSEK